MSIDSRYRNRFINLGRPIFSLNHSGASAATVSTIPTTFGVAHARCYTRTERANQFATLVGSSQLDSLTVLLLFHPPINSIAIYLIIINDFIFSLHRPAPAIRHFFWLFVIAGDDRQWNQPRDCAMTWAFHVLQKICLIKISSQFISTFGRYITLPMEYLGSVAVFQ